MEEETELVKTYNILKVFKLYASLPVLTATPTYMGRQGEIVLVDDGASVRQLCAYESGTWRCASLASSLTFTSVTPPSGSNPSGDATWTDVDGSATIPAGAVAAQIYVRNANSATIGVRAKGSAADTTIVAYASNSIMVTTDIDVNRKFQIYSTDHNNTTFFIMGYWK